MKAPIIALAVAAALLAAAASAQEPAAPDRAAVVKAAREVADSARYCSFITMAEDGQPQARIIDLLPLEPDLTAWIGTAPGMRKVAQVRQNPRATLICF